MQLPRTRRRGRLTRAVVPAIAIAMIATACSSGDGATDEPSDPVTESSDPSASPTASGDPGILVVGTTEKPSTIDPAEVYEKMASDFLFNTTDRLVALEPGTGDAVPGVAESYEISDDGLVYTFTLRSGVTFQDGSDLTSEDVKWSLERAMNISHPDGASFLIGGITSIETPDELTVVITIGAPNVTFLSRLAYTVGSILPSDSDAYTAPDEAFVDPSGDDVAEFITSDVIVGSGPYRMTDYSPDLGATFEAWDGYWGEAPKIPKVRVAFYESTAQMANALRNDEIDLNINDFGPAERTALTDADNVTVAQGEGGRIRYIVFDVTQPPFDDPAVRRTIAATVDRQRIIDDVFEGVGSPIFSMVPPAYPSSVDAISTIEAEVDGPISFDLWYPLNKYGDTEQDVGESIARSLNESDLFDVTTQSADWAAEYASNLSTGAYGAFLLGWYPDYIDPDDYIEPFYDSEGFLGYYSSAEMDALIDRQHAETDLDARVAIFKDIQELAAKDMPLVPLYEESFQSYFVNGLTGVENSVDISGSARWWLIGR